MEEIRIDEKQLIMWTIGAVLIAVGVPLFFLGRYFQAPEGERKQKARDLKVVAIVWMAVGVLIYIGVLTGFIAKP